MSASTHKHEDQSHICLRDFFRASQGNIIIPRRPNVFLPDEWTQVFAAGLEKLPSLSGNEARNSVLEIGVGTGIVMAGLLTQPAPPARYTGVDICGDAILSAQALAKRHEWDVSLRKSDLLNDLPDSDLHHVTHVIACIPQVPAEVDLSAGDNSAHYYRPQGSSWDTFGLGLNAALLEQARLRTPQASVTLNLSGRPGLNRLKDLFEQHGYQADVVHETMVSQHSGTSLQSLVRLEQEGHEPFEFYADESGREQISATQAESRRRDHESVFHKVYVLSAPAL